MASAIAANGRDGRRAAYTAALPVPRAREVRLAPTYGGFIVPSGKTLQKERIP